MIQPHTDHICVPLRHANPLSSWQMHLIFKHLFQKAYMTRVSVIQQSGHHGQKYKSMLCSFKGCLLMLISQIMIRWYSRFLWADVPVSRPAPSWSGFEALLWESDSASHVTELRVCQTCRTPVPHQSQFSLVFIL